MTDPTSSISQDDRTMALLAYLLAIPTGFIAPLILFFVKKDQSRFVAYHAMQALILEVAVCILFIICGMAPIIGPLLLMPAVWVLNIVALVIAALSANRGEWYSFLIIGDFTRKQLGMS